MCPLTLGEGRISERNAYPLHPAGMPAASLSGVIRRLRSHACRGAPQGLLDEGPELVHFPA
jgi:hypothetical protein